MATPRTHVGRGTLLLSLAAATGLTAQQPHIPFGTIVPEIRSPTDSSQRYAAYIPSTYTPERRWPLVIAMDPRGRALVPLERAVAGAERHGYIVLSSYGTESDGPAEPNLAAVNAMLSDAQGTFALDERRIYFLGFSGTARLSWAFAQQLEGYIAGLIGFGAGLPPGLHPNQVPVPFFGGTGRTDYNFDEVQQLARVLDTTGHAHRVAEWEGPHTWPPHEIFTEALGWMDLQARIRGLLPEDPTRTDSMLGEDIARARQALADGHRVEARDRVRAVLRDYQGASDRVGVRPFLDSLQALPEVQNDVAAREKAVADNLAYGPRMGRIFSAVRQARAPSASRILEQLRIADYTQVAAGSGEAALGARRALEHALIIAAFYEARHYLSVQQPDRALVVLDVAEGIRPGLPMACAHRREALTMAGRTAELPTCAPPRPLSSPAPPPGL